MLRPGLLETSLSRPSAKWLGPSMLSERTLGLRIDSEPTVAEMRTLLRAYFDGPPPAAFSLYVVDCLLKKWHRRLRNWGPGSGLNRLRQSLRTARLDKPLERLYIDRWFTTQVRAWLALADGRPPAWLQIVVE